MHKVHNSGINVFDTFSCPDDIPCSAYEIVMKFHPWTEYDKGEQFAWGT